MKMIGSDYDGTLNRGGINDTKLAAIKKWRRAGHKFGIVSGRGWNFRSRAKSRFFRRVQRRIYHG